LLLIIFESIMKKLLMSLLLVNLVLAISLLAHGSDSQNKPLNQTEQKIRLQVKQNIEQAKFLLEKSVNINSGTMNFDGVRAVGKLYQQAFDSLGLQITWVSGDAFNRAGHLIATHKATQTKQDKNGQSRKPLKILMIGHLDTVFAKDDQFQRYTTLDERFVAGPGITDMKGGDVIIIEVIRALKQLNLLNHISIQVVMTGDEEKSGKPLSLSKKALIDAAKWADIALGFEDGDGDIKTAVTARRGAISWQLKVTGKPAHSSQIFRDDIGFGAIYETARILNQFRLQLSKEELLTVNPGLITGGTQAGYDASTNKAKAFGKANVIAQITKVTGDIRALSPEQEGKAKQIMQSIVSDNLAHTDAVITFDEGYPPMAPTQGNQQLLAMYDQVSRDLGYNQVVAVNPRRAGAADISFAANHVEMALDGLGLMGDGGHTKNEVADMASFAKNIEKAALLIYRLSERFKN
jgi:glutamate carboxypeptidase